MTKAEKDQMREMLDVELSFCFKRDSWEAAWTLLHYAWEIGIVNMEEYRWLWNSMDCLQAWGGEKD